MAPLSTWTVEEVASWAALTPLPLDVASKLHDNAINGQVLQSLTEEDMIAMGIDKFGWRRQLLLCRQELREQLEQTDEQNENSIDAVEIHSAPSTPRDHLSESRLATPRLRSSFAIGLGNDRAAEREVLTLKDLACKADRLQRKTVPGYSGLSTGVQSVCSRDEFAMMTMRPVWAPVDSGASSRDESSMPLRFYSTMDGTRSDVFSDPATADIVTTKHSLNAAHSPRLTCSPRATARSEQKAVDACSVEQAKSAEFSYLVDNSQLRSGQAGLEYHRSTSLSDACKNKVAVWGSVIEGCPLGNDWIKVDEEFLPTHLNGVSVLRRVIPRQGLTLGPSGCNIQRGRMLSPAPMAPQNVSQRFRSHIQSCSPSRSKLAPVPRGSQGVTTCVSTDALGYPHHKVAHTVLRQGTQLGQGHTPILVSRELHPGRHPAEAPRWPMRQVHQTMVVTAPFMYTQQPNHNKIEM